MKTAESTMSGLSRNSVIKLQQGLQVFGRVGNPDVDAIFVSFFFF